VLTKWLLIRIEDVRKQMETNLYGPVRTIQAVLPSTRTKKSGVIVNISSAVYFKAWCTIPIYAASKWALEGMHARSKRTSVPFRVSAPSNGYVLLDQLLTEATGMTEAFAMGPSPFSIRVVLFEPSDMRSNFVSPSQLDLPDIPDVYKGTVSDAVMKGFLDMHGKQRVDPVRAARLIVEEILRPCVEPPLLRIPLGREALELMGEKVRGLEEATRALGDVGLGVDFPEKE
jgi:NAD(P)-dependent dehydrogenase (short-subunit alcohol dehydrogenase family)